MSYGLGKFVAQVNGIGGGGIELHFKREPHSNQPALGLVVLKSYLIRNYPQLKFTLKESRNSSVDVLQLNTYLESLLVLHELCTSTIYTEGDPDSTTTLENAYSMIAAVVRNEMLKGQHKNLEKVLKNVLFIHAEREFQLLKEFINEKFKDAHFIVVDPNLIDYINQIDRLKDHDLSFQISKKDILLALIAEHLRVINNEAMPNKIKVYENILKQYHLDSAEKINELAKYYDKHVKAIYTAFNQAEKAVPIESGLNRSSPRVINLYQKLQILRNYGEELKIQLIAKGQIICNLADNLKAEADEFFRKKEITELDLANFKANFAKELKGESKELSQSRVKLSKIIANVLIALSGIGLIALAAKAIHSYKTDGHVHLFFTKKHTTSERHFIAVQEARSLLAV